LNINQVKVTLVAIKQIHHKIQIKYSQVSQNAITMKTTEIQHVKHYM